MFQLISSLIPTSEVTGKSMPSYSTHLLEETTNTVDQQNCSIQFCEALVKEYIKNARAKDIDKQLLSEFQKHKSFTVNASKSLSEGKTDT